MISHNVFCLWLWRFLQYDKDLVNATSKQLRGALGPQEVFLSSILLINDTRVLAFREKIEIDVMALSSYSMTWRYLNLLSKFVVQLQFHAFSQITIHVRHYFVYQIVVIHAVMIKSCKKSLIHAFEHVIANNKIIVSHNFSSFRV